MKSNVNETITSLNSMFVADRKYWADVAARSELAVLDAAAWVPHVTKVLTKRYVGLGTPEFHISHSSRLCATYPCRAFRDVLPLLEKLEDLEWFGNVVQTSKSTWGGGYVEYIFDKRLIIRLVPDESLGESANRCRLVQIGEKTVTEPIYEMRCGG
jgi:hypothetical protein